MRDRDSESTAGRARRRTSRTERAAHARRNPTSGRRADRTCLQHVARCGPAFAGSSDTSSGAASSASRDTLTPAARSLAARGVSRAQAPAPDSAGRQNAAFAFSRLSAWFEGPSKAAPGCASVSRLAVAQRRVGPSGGRAVRSRPRRVAGTRRAGGGFPGAARSGRAGADSASPREGPEPDAKPRRVPGLRSPAREPPGRTRRRLRIAVSHIGARRWALVRQGQKAGLPRRSRGRD